MYHHFSLWIKQEYIGCTVTYTHTIHIFTTNTHALTLSHTHTHTHTHTMTRLCNTIMHDTNELHVHVDA